MFDKIEKIGENIIQHGKENDRIYLMHFAGDAEFLIPNLNKLAQKNGYSKIVAKIPASDSPLFLANNYKIEAAVPQFFAGEDGFFLAKYFSDSRKKIAEKELLAFQKLLKTKRRTKKIADPDFEIRKIQKSDIPKLTELYENVFASYPFPIFSEEYLRKTLREDVIYFGAFAKNKLIGAASAEVDREFSNAEMTDFAVSPEFRGNNLALFLLREMEKEMQKIGIKTLFTIARLNSPGMNATFARAGYFFGGTLPNNTNIAGNLESMNVWHKQI